jgi:tellurite resistance-related uncharacterized protein
MTASLPDGLVCYRELGPFDETSLPSGLRAEHRLKLGTWALLTVLDGSIRFRWDDGRVPDAVELAAGDSIAIPPALPHHLETHGFFRLVIAFHRAAPPDSLLIPSGLPKPNHHGGG